MTVSETISIRGPVHDGFNEILTPAALEFVANLQRKFGPAREELLAKRVERQKALDEGAKLDFLPETAHIRAGDWQVAPAPPDLLDRRVEITGPVDRKMIINALNSGAKVFMADFEDANSPTWTNVIEGQINLVDAIERSIEFLNPDGRVYRLNQDVATLLVRPRGWHLPENHVVVDGAPISASLLDFGLYFFHNARKLVDAGTGPYFYLPKLQSHLEARLWNDVFVFAQDQLGISQGTIKATVLVETILAAFEMEEILYELRDHSAGLNAGRWDFIFSIIKTFRHDRETILPDRAQITMCRAPTPTCSQNLPPPRCPRHMAAFIPSVETPRYEVALANRDDKLRESRFRRHLGCSSRSRAGGRRDIFRRLGRPAKPGREAPRGRGTAANDLLDSRSKWVRQRRGVAQQHHCRHPLHRILVAWRWCGRTFQSDGRRGDCRNLQVTGLAVDSLRCLPEGRPPDNAGVG